MPSEALVRSWAIDNVDGFSARYARAREIQADVLAEDTVEIADTEEDPQKARVRIDARKWFASKVAPKKYGDRIQQDVTLDLGDALTARLDAAKARLNGA